MTIDTSRESVELLASDHQKVGDNPDLYAMGHPHHWKTAQVLTALLAERDAALAEVARLSTPPDDAEVEAAHREWFATTYPHTYADVQSDYEALDAFVTSEEAWAAATLAAHAARRKE